MAALRQCVKNTDFGRATFLREMAFWTVLGDDYASHAERIPAALRRDSRQPSTSSAAVRISGDIADAPPLRSNPPVSDIDESDSVQSFPFEL